MNDNGNTGMSDDDLAAFAWALAVGRVGTAKQQRERDTFLAGIEAEQQRRELDRLLTRNRNREGESQ